MTDTPDFHQSTTGTAFNVTDNTVVATYDGRNIEELIGFVEEEYPCSYQGVGGTLYAGTDGLAFLGKFFLFDKKMYLKWVDVKVQQVDGGVAIQTRDDNPLLHEFMGIQNTERVWSTLVSLHNQALLDRTRTPAASDGTTTMRSRAMTAQPIQRRRQLRRMTSDPNKLTPAIEALFAEGDKENIIVDDSKARPPLARQTTKEAKPSRRTSLLQSLPILPTGAAAEAPKDGSATGAVTNNNLGVVQVSPANELEAIVGKLHGEFVCLYNGQKGTLYAGSTALYFAGERLFFPTRLTIKSDYIRQVKMIKGKPKSDVEEDISTPQTAEQIIKEQGIVIWTREGLSHSFLGMESPDQVWASLVALRNHASTGPNSPRPFGMRRMNSDPNLQSRTGAQLIAVAQVLDGDGKAAEAAAAPAEKELVPPVLTEEEQKKAWEQVLDKKNRYTTSFVKDHEFACTLDRFFKQYVADDAEFHIGKFMESSIGDKDVKISPWKPFEQEGRLVRKRVVRYVHPVNAPMAPPEAAARKEQIYHRFGDHGFTVETHTFVVGVPMADCFFVKDRLIVAANDKGKLLMSMEVELEFVKSTMFRGIITKTTNAEMTKFCARMRDYMAESLGEEVVAPKEEEKVEKKELVVEESGLFPGGLLSRTTITHALLAGVILMQFWILLDMQSMKRSMHRIESTCGEFRPVYYPSNQ